MYDKATPSARDYVRSAIYAEHTIIRDADICIDATASYRGDPVVIAVPSEEGGRFLGWNLLHARSQEELGFVASNMSPDILLDVMRAHAAAIVCP